ERDLGDVRRGQPRLQQHPVQVSAARGGLVDGATRAVARRMTSVEAPARPWIGRALPRFEDARFTKGEAQFVDDLRMPGMLHAAFIRSPYAHARILGIDAGAARGLPGVHLVLTGADIADRIGAFPINPAEDAEIMPVTHPVLAVERVRYVGQPVAVVV